MKRIAARIPAALAMALLSACMAVPGCAHVPGPVRDFGVCVEHKMAPRVQDAMEAVASALAGAGFVTSLSALGVKIGFDVVDCAVAQIGARARIQMAGAPSDQLSRVQVLHADQWLSR